MKNLKMYGVETLNTQEMRETDGGGWVGDALRWIKRHLGFKVDHRYGKYATAHKPAHED